MLIVVSRWSALFSNVVGALCCQVAWLHKNDIFVGVLRAQRFEHATSYEPSPLNLGFPRHLFAPHPGLSITRFLGNVLSAFFH